ncbi:MAG: hypothetical protein ACOX1H_00260 [Pseudoramibacter sp.]|jgi:DNA-damage-inducible protein J
MNKPNAETRAALAEYAAMKKHPERYKRYRSFDDLMNEVLGDASLKAPSKPVSKK